jgi:heme exporter protein C
MKWALRKIVLEVVGVSTMLCWLTCLLLAAALYMIFFYVPTEETMGIIQRIFYVHVPAAWNAFLAFFVVMAASVQYLRTSSPAWDRLARASAEIGVLFCTMVLVTGPLWAKPVWNVWWTWDLRLTTTLVLWLMYVAYLMLRQFVEGERGATFAAVFGIIAFIDVPFVYMSIRWWRTLHPAPVIGGRGQSGLEAPMLVTLFVCVAAMTLVYIYLLQHRIAIGRMGHDLEDIRRTLTAYEQKTQPDVLIENEDFIIEEYTFQEYKKS